MSNQDGTNIPHIASDVSFMGNKYMYNCTARQIMVLYYHRLAINKESYHLFTCISGERIMKNYYKWVWHFIFIDHTYSNRTCSNWRCYDSFMWDGTCSNWFRNQFCSKLREITIIFTIIRLSDMLTHIPSSVHSWGAICWRQLH